jgi:hypothetical protein
MRAGSIGGTWIVTPNNRPSQRPKQRPKPADSDRDAPDDEKPSETDGTGKLVDRSV